MAASGPSWRPLAGLACLAWLSVRALRGRLLPVLFQDQGGMG